MDPICLPTCPLHLTPLPISSSGAYNEESLLLPYPKPQWHPWMLGGYISRGLRLCIAGWIRAKRLSWSFFSQSSWSFPRASAHLHCHAILDPSLFLRLLSRGKESTAPFPADFLKCCPNLCRKGKSFTQPLFNLNFLSKLKMSRCFKHTL